LFTKPVVRLAFDLTVSADFQSIAALVVVAFAATGLVLRALAKRKQPGCGSDCGAVSPELKRLQARLKK
jgi:hypothetical protein